MINTHLSWQGCFEIAHKREFLDHPLSFQLPPLIENKWFLDSNHIITTPSSTNNLLVFATRFPVATISGEIAAAFAHQIPLPLAEEKSLLLQVTLTKLKTSQNKFFSLVFVTKDANFSRSQHTLIQNQRK